MLKEIIAKTSQIWKKTETFKFKGFKKLSNSTQSKSKKIYNNTHHSQTSGTKGKGEIPKAVKEA